MGNYYADVPRGMFLVRGENVLLLGEIVSPSSVEFVIEIAGLRGCDETRDCECMVAADSGVDHGKAAV